MADLYTRRLLPIRSDPPISDALLTPRSSEEVKSDSAIWPVALRNVSRFLPRCSVSITKLALLSSLRLDCVCYSVNRRPDRRRGFDPGVDKCGRFSRRTKGCGLAVRGLRPVRAEEIHPALVSEIQRRRSVWRDKFVALTRINKFMIVLLIKPPKSARTDELST
jgi:hypothetical protein